MDTDLQKAKESNDAWPSANAREIRLTIEAPSIHPVSLHYPKQFIELPDWRVLLCGGISLILGVSVGLIVLCLTNHCPV